MDELQRARARRKRRREQARRKQKFSWFRLLLVVFIFLSVLSGIGWGIYSGVTYIYHRVTEASGTVTVDERDDHKAADTVAVEQKALDKPVYILVVGRDTNNPSQSDTLFLMSVNVDQKTMDIIGIPSNTKIDSRDQKSVSMINQMYAQGGIELTKAVVEDIFHISIPYYVVVDRDAFKKTNDVLGDRQFYVEQNMEHTDSVTGEQDINLKRGFQTLSGDKAMAYLRYADPKNDTFSRVQRQERFLKSWIEDEHDSFFITKAWHIWRVWNHYDTNISTMDAVKLMYHMGNMEKDNIHFYILPGEKEELDQSVYWNINPTEAQRLVGIMMGNLSADEISQFVAAPAGAASGTNNKDARKEAVSTDTSVKTPSEPGADSQTKR